MSVKASTWAWEMPLKGNEKLVLLALADHANDEGKCWPHIEKISEKCGISRSPVIEHLKKLHELKIFSKETIYDNFGKKRGNIYTLNLSLSPDLLRSKLLRTDLLRTENTSTKSGFTPSLSQDSGPLIIEPSLESSLNHQSKYKRARVKKVLHTLPDQFVVTDHHRELAKKNGWPSPDEKIDEFRDHHLARGTQMADWDRAFYTWLRNGKKFKEEKTSNEKNQRNNPRPKLRPDNFGEKQYHTTEIPKWGKR